MTYSQWRHALQVMAEERMGTQSRAAGYAEDAAFAAARRNLQN